MNYNFHTHTYRCSHAYGTEEEYIKKAIEGGIKQLGFSDHLPFRFPDGYESYFRIPVVLVEDYFKTLTALREKYKDEIEIHIGFEMEYYPLYFEDMLRNAREYGAEYLILGQHFLSNEHPDGYPVKGGNTSVERLKEFVSSVVSAIESGVFTYVAHPDNFGFIGDEEIYREEVRKICVASREMDVPLEINFLGIRENRHYPNEVFWKVAAEEGSPVTFGFDAHTVSSAYDGESLQKAETLVRELNLNYIGAPKLRKIL